MSETSTPTYSLVYLSTALKPFSDEALHEVLQKSRENNTRRGITGMLLYKNQHFMQALEGPEKEVRDLMEVIRRDPRHVGVVVLMEGVENRHFDGWSMGFENLESNRSEELPGYAEFSEVDLTPDGLSSVSRARKLLSVFWKRMEKQ